MARQWLAAQNHITLSLDTTIVQHVDYQLSEVLLDPCSTVAQQQEETDNNCKTISQLEEKNQDSGGVGIF